MEGHTKGQECAGAEDDLVKEHNELSNSINDSLIVLQDHAYDLGFKRGAELAKSALEQQLAQLQLLANLVDDDAAVSCIIDTSIEMLGNALKKARGGRMSHTKGLLHIVAPDDALWARGISDDTRTCVAFCGRDGPEQARADAHRLVACWNALEGVPTEEIEKRGDFFSSAYHINVAFKKAKASIEKDGGEQ